MKKNKIAIFPYVKNSPNKYIERMAKAITYAFPNVELLPFPRTRNLVSVKNFDYVWLNWFENLPQSNKIKEFILKIGTIFVLKIMGIKIVASFHNKRPHDSNDNIWERLLFNYIFRSAHRIIILSSDSKDILKEKFGKKVLKKVVLVPHPTYECTPKNNNPNNKFSILFFGFLRPYKNIDLIFELDKIYHDIQFTIAGNAIDNDYKIYLKKKAKSIPNVTLIPHFLTENEIDTLIESNSILLLPYNIESSLNSGVIIHAICKKINMIVPQIGTVNQLKNKNMIFSYTYNSQKSHLQELIRMIQSAKYEYENEIAKFNNRVNILYDDVMSTNSPEALSYQILQVFNDD